MSIQVRSIHAQSGIPATGAMGGRSVGRLDGARLIQVALTLYLAPALLVVLLVGGIGMLVLAVARTITGSGRGPEMGHGGPAEAE